MTRWIGVPICDDCNEPMPPDEDGDFVCPECDEYMEGGEDD